VHGQICEEEEVVTQLPKKNRVSFFFYYYRFFFFFLDFPSLYVCGLGDQVTQKQIDPSTSFFLYLVSM
jgi:hypothetical protein